MKNNNKKLNPYRIFLASFFAIAGISSLEARVQRVLFLGDSQSLASMGEYIYKTFKQEPDLEISNFTVCAVNPTNWMKQKYTTGCGYIEQRAVYKNGMLKETKRAETWDYGTPKAVTIPQIKNVIAEMKPDVLIVQSGDNSMPNEKEEWTPSFEAFILKSYFDMQNVALKLSPDTKILWVSPPDQLRVKLWYGINSKIISPEEYSKGQMWFRKVPEIMNKLVVDGQVYVLDSSADPELSWDRFPGNKIKTADALSGKVSWSDLEKHHERFGTDGVHVCVEHAHAWADKIIAYTKQLLKR